MFYCKDTSELKDLYFYRQT